MRYRVEASIIGRKCEEVLERGERYSRVRHVFANTLYLQVGRDMVIVNRKNNRSPNTITIPQDSLNIPFYSYIRIGDNVEIGRQYIRVGELEIGLENAEGYFPEKIDRIRELDELCERMYLKGLKTILLLYYISTENIPILGLSRFKEFLNKVVYPFSKGDLEAIKKTENYKMLLGLGQGFTPSGDDYLLGFISFLNLLDDRFQIPRVILEDEILFSNTNWVSAMFLKYAQNGLYDEDVYQLLSSISLKNETSFMNSILHLARRGHTSGLDITLGVLTGLASVIDRVKSRNLTERLINCTLGSFLGEHVENIYPGCQRS
ncbi:MAG: DUF2877 domain-containing protein [Nitrososphaerota archaeon]